MIVTFGHSHSIFDTFSAAFNFKPIVVSWTVSMNAFPSSPLALIAGGWGVGSLRKMSWEFFNTKNTDVIPLKVHQPWCTCSLCTLCKWEDCTYGWVGPASRWKLYLLCWALRLHTDLILMIVASFLAFIENAVFRLTLNFLCLRGFLLSVDLFLRKKRKKQLSLTTRECLEMFICLPMYQHDYNHVGACL